MIAATATDDAPKQGYLRGRKVAVAGAGIAGLTAALALNARGAEVSLFEQAPELSEVGAGLQISPNGYVVLDRLGLGPALRKHGDAIKAVQLHDGPSGRLIAKLPTVRGPLPWLALHRADLIAILAAQARDLGIPVTTGTKVGTDSVLPGDALHIGADGLHSVMRAELNGKAEPFFTGQIAWRALVRAKGPVAPVARVFMAPGRHVVTYPLRGGSLVNIVAIQESDAWVEEGWSLPGDLKEFRDVFAGFNREVAALIDRADQVNKWGLFRHPVAARWQDGESLALLGDAAHPTLPFLAQGANLAIEDAWVLAACLAKAPPSRALPMYQAERKPRVERAIAAANANARNYHLRAPMRWPAFAALWASSRVMPGFWTGRLDWLHGHDVTRIHLLGC